MLWNDVDLGAAVWTVRERKSGQPNLVPLPPRVVNLLEELRPITGGSARVFDGVSEENEERDWWGVIRMRALALAAKCGVPMEHFTRHDLRRTCATGLGNLQVPDEVIALVLGHKKRDITGRVYNLSHRMPERASALNAWAAHVQRIVTGEPRRADVLPLGTRRKGA